MIEGPVERITHDEIVKAIGRMKTRKTSGPSEVNNEMVIACGETGIRVLMELCQSVLDGKRIPDEWRTSVVVPIFKKKGDVMNCGAYRRLKLLEQGMKIVERVLERRMRALMKLDEMQFGFMPGKGTTDILFLLRRMQEEYHDKKRKLFCVLWI